MLERYRGVRSLTEDYCAPLTTEDYVPQPVVFASPPKWHLAHTTWFFEEFVLKPYATEYRLFDPDFSYLFNSYYNAVGDRVLRTDRGNLTRPGVQEVYDYRRYVDEAVHSLLQEELPAEVSAVIELGLHHEQQHQELLITDLKYVLAHNPTWPVYHKDRSLVSQANVETGQVTLGEGVYEIGHRGDGFCYDNECARHKVYLHGTTLEKKLVTNADFLAFMIDGGYDTSSLWLDDGWSWVKEDEIDAPLYWHHVNDAWHQYTLQGLQPVEADQILAHINFYEASAFAEWAGRRLPTEFEWEAAAQDLPWGVRWEWTNSAYLPYPGFRTVEGAIGEYNGKFMINQMVLRGSSTATSPDHSRRTYRNFFHPHLSWQCTGIRLAHRHHL